MIEVQINGGNKKEIALCYDAFDFAMKYLMPRKRNLFVEISLLDLEGDVDGYHCDIEKGYHEVELQKGLIEENLITALFHEMVHVKQSERNEMKDKGIIKVWKGVEYLNIFSTVDEYKSLPWEEEAYRLQEEMWDKWIKNRTLTMKILN